MSFFDFHIPQIKLISSDVSRQSSSVVTSVNGVEESRDAATSKYILEFFNANVGHLHNVQLKIYSQGIVPTVLRYAQSKNEEERLRSHDKPFKQLRFEVRGRSIITESIDIRRRSFIYLSMVLPTDTPTKGFDMKILRRGKLLARYKRKKAFTFGSLLIV